MKKHILGILVNTCTNESRVLKQGNTLKRNGYNFSIAALHDKCLKFTENTSGISITRIRLRFRELLNSNIMSKIKKKAPFVKVFHIFTFVEFILKIIYRFRKTDFLHCYSLEGLLVGVCYKLSKPSVKLIYDAREYETETMSSIGLRKKLRKFIERLCIKFADSVITVNKSIANEYVRLYGIKRPYMVLNCPKNQKIEKQEHFRNKFKIGPEKLIFLYQGALFEGRGINNILDAFSSLPEDSNCVCVFMGYGDLVGEIKRCSKNNNRIFYHEALHPDQVLSHTSSADVGLCLIENKCLSYYYCLPNKLFEYAMAGLPIISNNLPEVKKLIQHYNIGHTLANDNQLEITLALKAVNKKKILEWKKNLPSIVKKYNWATIVR